MSNVFSTAYFPPISYLAGCLQREEIEIEIFETYRKQTIRNHCNIYGPNGKQKLSVPVIKVHGNHTMTKDIRISYHQNWQQIHWRSIATAYNNSPFFLYYRDYFEPFFRKKYDFLLDLNTRILEVIFIVLKGEKKISYTDHFENPPAYQPDLSLSPYIQAFENKYGFIPGLSVIDLIFNIGPEAKEYLLRSSFTTDFTDFTKAR